MCSRQYLCTVFSGECVGYITDHYKHIVQINACAVQKVKNKIFVQLPHSKLVRFFKLEVCDVPARELDSHPDAV